MKKTTGCPGWLRTPSKGSASWHDEISATRATTKTTTTTTTSEEP